MRTVCNLSMAGAIVLAVACSDADTGANGGAAAGSQNASGGATMEGGGGSGGNACPSAATDECGICMSAACCEAQVDCEGDPLCIACVTGEDDEACEENEATHARVDAFLSCRGGDCAEACIGVVSGECDGLLDGLVAPACVTCMEASCCDEVSACNGSEGCWESCFTSFTEAGCHADPDGHALFHALGECASESCGSECR